MNVERLAEFANSFELHKRNAGDEFYALVDDAPDWAKEVVYAAHEYGDMLPNDWTYRITQAVATEMAEHVEYGGSPDEMSGAGNLIPVYTTELLDWAASHAYRQSLVDEALTETDSRSLFALLSQAFREETAAIWQTIAVHEAFEVSEETL